jgi:acetyltransferase-like isoleucine patch superfamily enzyme
MLYRLLIAAVRVYYNRVWGTHIGHGTRISLTAKIDKTYPDGVYIGKHSAVTFRSSVMTHDFVNGVHLRTTIGNYCFIGAGATIMPGVTIGDHCIIGAGSVVLRDVASHSLVFGNPARVMEKGIMTGEFGRRLRNAEASQSAVAPDLGAASETTRAGAT